MKFLAPMAFWFAASIPIVILFYLLKRKRVARLVPSTLLWQKFLAETQASAPFQKLRHNWLLILQLLLLILAILALARPYRSSSSSEGTVHVVILDASASMQSTDESPSRFEKARAQALQLVDTIHDNDLMVVLQASANTEVKQSATSEKAALRRALHSAAPSDTPTRLREALKLAETLVKDKRLAEIHLYTDGTVDTLTDFENSGLPVVYHRMGQRGNNVGITSLDVRPNPENPAQRAVFANISNYSSNQHQIQIELRFEDQLLEVKPLTLKPRETSPHAFIAAQTQDGTFHLRIINSDDLPVDNQASVISLLPKPVNVLLVTAGNNLLSKALRVLPNVQLSTQSTLISGSEEFDLVVLDNVTPLVWPTDNVLSFRAAQTNWFDTLSPLETPAIVDWRANHPLLRFVSFDNVQIADALAVKTPSWAVALVDSPQTPLLLAGELGRQRIVWVSFDPLHSTWPLRLSFPIFIANAVEWLNPATINSSQLSIQAGSPFRLAVTESIATAQIQLPDGSQQSWEVNPAKGELIFGNTHKQGVYQVTAGTNQVLFTVNLLDPAESDTTPKEELNFGKYVQVSTSTLRRANLELWRWIAAAGIAILLFEWWYYHKRTA